MGGIKVKVSLARHESLWGNRGVVSLIFNIAAGWKSVDICRSGRFNSWKDTPLFVEFEAAWIPDF